MKINNQKLIKITILNYENKVVVVFNNCIFMSMKALNTFVRGNVDFLTKSAEEQRYAYLRPKKFLVEDGIEKISFDL